MCPFHLIESGSWNCGLQEIPPLLGNRPEPPPVPAVQVPGPAGGRRRRGSEGNH
ncbi:hypothetical protein GDO81_029737 [Engystomops pustulosus]|uniref:Uncharacterized protein n=1 Tax=Engystomops pustulosus TaxID=76066 RepID=A0AAV6YLX7_ENGPU|nr:hypothetical protein GDO81_029737 [Engystomops pustulosus]